MYTANSRKPIRVGLVENRPLVVIGLYQLLQRDGFRVCWKAASLDDACVSLDAVLPDVVLIAANRVVAFREEIARISARTNMLVLMDGPDKELQERMVVAGACGIVNLADRAELIVRAISAIHAGEICIERSARRRAMEAWARRRERTAARVGTAS